MNVSDIAFQLGEYGPYIMFLLKYYTIDPNYRIEFLQLLFLNIVVNTILKYSIQEKRPIHNTNYVLAPNYGMPSLHSQLAIFMVLYRYNIYKIYNSSQCIQNTIIHSILVFLMILVSMQRIYSGNHSLKQVIVGLCVGILFVFVSI